MTIITATTSHGQIQTAMTALDHLTHAPEGAGINRVRAALGAHNVRVLEDGVDFRFKGSRKVNYCRITLNGDDLYDVMIGKLALRGRNMGSVTGLELFDGMDAGELSRTFYAYTGLRTHL